MLDQTFICDRILSQLDAKVRVQMPLKTLLSLSLL